MIVLVVVALVFGPSRVTGLARALGESIHEFRAAQHRPDVVLRQGTVEVDRSERNDDEPPHQV